MSKFKITAVLSAIIIASFIIFVSCSASDENQIAQNKQTTSENLEEFIAQYVETKLALKLAFSENLKTIPSVSKIASGKKALSNVKNEDELIFALKKTGIKNANVIVGLMKQLKQLENNFRAKNSYFYSLDIDQRQILLNIKLDSILQKKRQIEVRKKNKTFSPPKNPCAEKYYEEMDDCNGDYLRCGTFAIIAAAEGIIPGLIAGAYCMWDFSDCKSDSARHYNQCVGG